MKSVIHPSVFHKPQEFEWSWLFVPLATAGMIIAVIYLYLYSPGDASGILSMGPNMAP